MSVHLLEMVGYAERNMSFHLYAWMCFPSICCDAEIFMKIMTWLGMYDA